MTNEVYEQARRWLDGVPIGVASMTAREYLNANWIEPIDRAHVEANGSPNPYDDDTYNMYAEVAASLGPETILEIGVYKGYSMAAMLFGSASTVHVALGVDKSLGGPGVTRRAIFRLREAFPNCGIGYLEIDSQIDWQEVPKGPYDIVHIDGDHSYEAASNDLEHFGSLVSERGVVIVHDTIDPPVYQATMEFAARHNMHYTIVQNACGNILLSRKAK